MGIGDGVYLLTYLLADQEKIKFFGLSALEILRCLRTCSG